MALIYLSSTYVDLEEHRQSVYRALRQLRHDVIAMEDYVATDQRPLDKCLNDIASCDVYLLIVAWRYGYEPLHNNPLRKSITELEYRQARLLNKRCLIFLLNPEAAWPRAQMEFGDGLTKLNDFRSELMTEATVGLFETADDLARQVTVAIVGNEANQTTARVFHNLPRFASSSFVRRESIEQVLRESLLPTVPDAVMNLHGIGGVGKSAIALHVAHNLVTNREGLAEAHRFDAVIWFSAKRQFLTERGIIEVECHSRPLRDLLAAISITLEREDIVRAPEHHQSELALQALRRQRTLLLLDDYDSIDADALDFLRRLPPSTKVIITSRSRITGADKAIHVVELSVKEAGALITSEAQRRGVAIASDDLVELTRVTGRVPVAIVWSIAQIAYGFEARTIVDRLGEAGNDVARFCFDGLIETLRDTPAYRLLIALSLFAADTRKEDVAAVANMSDHTSDSDEGFVQLEHLSLMSRDGCRVNLLPLTRDFAQMELARDDNRQMYVERWKSRIMHIADAYRPQYWYDFNATAMHCEAENLRAALHWSRKREDRKMFLAIVVVVCWYDNYIGMWNELIQTAEEGTAIAEQCGDVRVEAELRSALLGFAYSQRGEFERAQHNVQCAIEIYRDKLKDDSALAFAMCHLAQVHRKRGDMEAAEIWYANAESIVGTIESSHRTRIAILFELGKLARDKREWVAATNLFNEVRRWLDEHPNDPLNQTQLRAAVLGHLALVEYFQRDLVAARSDCLESLRLFSALNLRVAFGPLFWRLAMIEHASGGHAEAKFAITHAVTWFSRLGMSEDLKQARELEVSIDAALGSAERVNDVSA